MALNTYLSIIALNVNGLSAPTKDRVAKWIRKQYPYKRCLQDSHLRLKDAHILNINGWEKIFCINGKENKAGVAILLTK